MSLPPGIDVTEITGPRFLAHLLNWGFYGVSLMQTYVYLIQYPRDPIPIKTLVFSTFLVETIQSILLTYSGFRDFVYNFGDVSKFNEISIGFYTLSPSTGIVAFTAQCFYAYRLRILSGSTLLAFVILGLATIQFAGCIATTVVIGKITLFSDAIGTASKVTATIWEGGGALCDVVIAICMIFTVSLSLDYFPLNALNVPVPQKLRTREPSLPTKIILTNLIRLVVGTGALTAACSVLCLVVGYLPGKPTYYQPATIALGKVYFNSIMVLLNARVLMQKHRTALQNVHASPDDTIRFAKSTVVTVELQERERERGKIESSERSETTHVSHLSLGKENRDYIASAV